MNERKVKSEIDPVRVYTTEEAAAFAGVDPSVVSRLCREGKVKAKKQGMGLTNRWSIPGTEVQRLQEAYSPACA